MLAVKNNSCRVTYKENTALVSLSYYFWVHKTKVFFFWRIKLGID